MRHANTTRSFNCLALLLIWLSGLLVGCVFYFVNEALFLSMMRGALIAPVSFVGLFLIVFLPLILTYFSVLTEKPIIILIVCFFKSAAFTFCGLLISRLFFHASWLIRFLFLFTDSCFLSALLILWFVRFSCPRFRGDWDVKLCAVFGVLVALVDYCRISPFLMSLL